VDRVLGGVAYIDGTREAKKRRRIGMPIFGAQMSADEQMGDPSLSGWVQGVKEGLSPRARDANPLATPHAPP